MNLTKRQFAVWPLFAALLASCPAAAGGLVYANAGNTKGPWNGKSWATAFRGVQRGLDAARKAGGGEVWVAAGTYKPTSGTDRKISFQLRSGVALYGGFAGAETKRDQRDFSRNVTVLSGDIGKADDNSDNSYHVVIGADDATMDGFTITGGSARPPGPPGPRPGMRRPGPGEPEMSGPGRRRHGPGGGPDPRAGREEIST